MLIKLEASLYLNGAARGWNLNFFWVILVSEITLLQNTRPETEFDPNYGVNQVENYQIQGGGFIKFLC